MFRRLMFAAAAFSVSKTRIGPPMGVTHVKLYKTNLSVVRPDEQKKKDRSFFGLRGGKL